MKARSQDEYCLIVEGPYLTVSEAEHALRDPFIEDWVEETGRFRVHNLHEMLIVPGVTLGQLGVELLDERLFEIASTDPEHPLTEHKARGVAEALKRQDMFDEISVEPRDGFGDEESPEDEGGGSGEDAGGLAGEADPS
ncbi:MAG TPA: hypothetical protein VM914_13150 [Pyrinomonadaceae bacterium]|jgi:hypothetical protein|nr:hypothetical protein [Pyrinomonadaceae bacterium]